MGNYILTTFFCIVFSFTTNAYCQYFEGKVFYQNIYLHSGTQDMLFEPVPEICYYKLSKRKIEVPNARDGQIEWEMEDFESKVGYFKKSSKRIDTSYIVTDKPLTYEKDGKTYFNLPDSTEKKLENPIIKYDLCNANTDTTTFSIIDTTFVISGLESKVILEYRGEYVVRQYYYCDTIKLHPKFYDCNSKFSRFYKLTNGALITQYINFETEGYDFIYQLTDIQHTQLDENIFILPKE